MNYYCEHCGHKVKPSILRRIIKYVTGGKHRLFLFCSEDCEIEFYLYNLNSRKPLL